MLTFAPLYLCRVIVYNRKAIYEMEGDGIMDINRIGSADNTNTLKGSIKVTNDNAAGGDKYTPSEMHEGGFFHNLGDKIKNIFHHEDKPPKEPGAYYPKPDGSGYDWYTESNPPPPKDNHGHWVIDTACGACDWYWAKESAPAQGPEYGPGYKPQE